MPDVILELINQPEMFVSLIPLALMLIILDVDNVIFVSILSGNLSPEDRKKAKQLNLLASLVIRIILLFVFDWLRRFDNPADPPIHIEIYGYEDGFTLQNILVILGGLFLLYKSTTEIHQKLEGPEGQESKKGNTLKSIAVSIFILNLVFSIDSVVTAVGMVDNIALMILGIIISIITMFIFQDRIGAFIDKHPTTKVLALSFLLLIGFFLFIEGLHFHVPKGYIYFAMAFSLGVEVLNISIKKKSKPVRLHMAHHDETPEYKEQAAKKGKA